MASSTWPAGNAFLETSHLLSVAVTSITRSLSPELPFSVHPVTADRAATAVKVRTDSLAARIRAPEGWIGSPNLSEPYLSMAKSNCQVKVKGDSKTRLRGCVELRDLLGCFNSPVSDYDVLRVFCAPNGGYGNELGVVREGSVMPDRDERQAFAAKLGFSETVFVDDPERGVIDIYTPSVRLAFAGYPCVGAAWLLDVPELVTPAGVVGTRRDGEFSWIEARAEWAAPRTFRQYGTAAEVDDLTVPAAGDWVYAWAWEDE